MTDLNKPKIENLPEPEQELTAEQAQEARGGKFALELDNAVSPRDPASKTQLATE